MNISATHTTLRARQAFFRTFTVLALLLTFNGIRAQTDSGALVQDTATYISTDTWSNNYFEEPDGPFLFYFGNGVIVTYDEAAANEIGSKLGIARPSRGRNLVGEFYSIGNYYSGPALNRYLQGYLGSNDKIYRSYGTATIKTQNTTTISL